MRPTVNTEFPFGRLIVAICFVSCATAYSQTKAIRNPSAIYDSKHRNIIQSNPGQATSVLLSRDGTSKVSQVDMTQQVKLIVEFKDEPMFLQQQHYPSRIFEPSAFQSRQTQFKSDLASLHQSAVKALKVALASLVVTREYYKVFNGAAITVPRAMVSQIAQLSYVKKIHIDEPVKAYLEQSVHQIRADSVWTRFGTKGDSVLVGIIDTGIDYADSALGGGFGPGFKVVGGYDFVNNDSDPMDDNGHGTHVAGIIAADGGGLEGVAPHAKLMAFKVLNQFGYGTESNIIAGIERAVDPNNDGNDNDKVDIVNMSLGGPGDPDDAASTAVDNAVKLGITFCIAAGNSGGFYSIGSPGTARLAITVGAVDSSDDLAYFSSKGPDGRICSIKPEVVAPGVRISSTYLNNTDETMSGTSMAAPFVTGVCALLKSLHKNWAPATIKSAVTTTAVDIGQEVMAQGAGRIDALNAAEVSAFAYPSDLSFGLDSSSFSNWTVVDTMFVANTNSNSQSFTMSFENLPSGVSLSAYPSTFSLASDDSQMVVITFGVDNTIVPFPLQGSCAYSGNGYVDGSKDTLHIPWAFVKAARVMFTFDQPNALFAISNTKVEFSDINAVWSDQYNAQLVMPKGVYDLVALFLGVTSDRCVVKEQVSLDSTSHISLFSTDATNSISFHGVDVNGQPLDSYSSSMNFLIIGFPDSLLFVGYTIPEVPDSLFCSNFSDRFTLASGQTANNGSNTLYNVQFDPLPGLQNSVSLTNLPTDFYVQNIHANFPPYSGMYKEMDCVNWENVNIPGEIAFGEGIQSAIARDFMGDWSGKLYLTKNKNERFNFSTSFTALDGPQSKTLFEYQWFTSLPAEVFNDSVGYFIENPLANRYLSPNGGYAAFGHAPFYPGVHSWNNILGKSNIFDFTDFYGAFNEGFFLSADSSLYTIYDERSNIIASDTESNFPSTGIDVPPGVYKYQVVNRDYFIRGVKGLATLTCQFDLRRSDADPPNFTTLRLLNSKNIPVDSLSKGEKGTLIFSSAGIASSLDKYGNLVEKYVSIAGDSTKLFYKRNGSANWISIPIVKALEDSSIGILYSADVTSTSEFDSAAIDLKIDLQDQSGNTSEWVMEPAYCVGKFGTPTAVVVNAEDNSVPKVFALYQNYPNPFNPSTVIKYDLPKATHVSLAIYNILGQRVASLVDGTQQAGHYSVAWNGHTRSGSVASGVYFLHFQSEEYVKTVKMLLLK